MNDRLKKLVVFLVFLGLAGFVLNLLIDNPYTHRIIRAAINEKVEEHTNLIIDFNAVKVTVLPPGIDLYGFYLAPAIDPNRPLVKASHAQARISLWSMFLGEFRLSSVEAGDPDVVWPPPWNFPGFLKTPVAETDEPVIWPPDFDLPIDRITLSNMQVLVDLPLTGTVPLKPSWLTMQMVGVDLDLAIDDWNDIQMRARVARANAAKDSAFLVEDGNLDLIMECIGTRVSVSRLRLGSERLNLEGTAFAELQLKGEKRTSSGLPLLSGGPSPPRLLDNVLLNANAVLEGDLSVLGTYLELGDTRGLVKGEADLKAFVPIESDNDLDFQVTGHGRVRDGFLDGFGLYDSKAEFAISPQGIDFTDVDVMIGEVSFGTGTGRLEFDDRISYEFKAKPKGLHLMDLLNVFGIGFDVIDTAITAPDLVIKGKGDPFSMSVKATGLFSDVTLPATPYDHGEHPVAPECLLDFNMAVTSDWLNLDGTEGICYEPQGSVPRGAAVTAGRIQAPSGAKFVSPVTVQGPIHFDADKGMDVRVVSEALDAALGRHFAVQQVDGKGKASSRIHGPFEKIRIDNQFDLNAARIAKLPLGHLTGSVTYVDGQVRWRDVRGQYGKGFVSLPKGSLSILDTLPVDLEIAAENVPKETVLEAFSALMPGVKLGFGIERVQGRLKGPLLFPLAHEGKIALTVLDLSLGDETLADLISADLESTKKGWSSQYVEVHLGDMGLTASFQHKRAFPFSFAEASGSGETWTSIGLHPDDEVTAQFATNEPEKKRGAARELAAPDHLGKLPFAGPYLKEANLAGRIDLKGQLRGTTNDLQGTFEGGIEDLRVFGSSLAPVGFRGFIRGSKIDVMLNHSGNSLEGRLSFDALAPGVPYEWFFSFNRMDLRALGTELFYSDPRNFAYLTADWNMKGKFADWWRSTGELVINDIRAKYVQDIGSQNKVIDLTQTEPVTMLFTKDGWKLRDDQDLFLKGRYMGLRLSVPENHPPERLALKMTGIVDMEVAKEFSPDIDTADGKLRIIAEVKGSAYDPKLALEVTDLKDNPFIAATWNPVKIGLAQIRPAFRDVRMRVVYMDGRLVIDTLKASKGPGTLNANGALNLFDADGEASRLDVNLKDAMFITPVAFLKNFETQVSGNIGVTGKGLPYKLTGDLTITRARSTREVDIRTEIFEALQKQSFKTNLVSDAPVMQFDLNVTADRSINIHNRNFKGILSADLQIKGDDINPIVSGQVEVNRGTFIYKRDFNITRGLVTFDDPVKPDPSLDILAVSDVGTYRVYIAVTGRASSPVVEYSVDPPTRENGAPISKLEILVLLSKGDLPQEGQSITDTQGAAASEVANLILGQFEDPVEKILDLTDQSVIRNVYVDTYPNEEGAPEVRLNMPLDLGEDFDVIFRVDQQRQEIASEYSLHDNITLSGSVEQSNKEEAKTEEEQGPADAAANLRFRFSFE